ncbi:MAG: hypothetical protein ACI9TB_002850, partial [Parasphingorhabdus sp.]
MAGRGLIHLASGRFVVTKMEIQAGQYPEKDDPYH